MRLRIVLPLLLAGGVMAGAAVLVLDDPPARGRAVFRPVLTGLDRPTDLALAPGETGRLYVAEQPGLVRVVEVGRILETPFLDLRGETAADGERGLLSLAFDPGWPARRTVYAHLTDRDGATRVLALDLAPDGAIGRRRVLLAVPQPYPNHNGGALRFLPDGHLYLGLGDGGGAFDQDRRAQDPAQPYGKLLRLDLAGGAPEVVATGLRNPWRMAVAPGSGDLIVADVGQDEEEEVDVIPAALLAPGAPAPNLGWSAYEGRRRLADHELVGDGPLIAPAWTYAHADGRCSVTGGEVAGADLPELAGRYVAADFCTGEVWSLALVDGSLADPRIEEGRLEQATAFLADGAGGLWATTLLGGLWRAEPTGGG